MNAAVGVKSIAYVAFALMAVMKAMSMTKEKKKADPVLQKDHRIAGKVIKVMPEQDGFILQIAGDGKMTWLLTDEPGCRTGDRISCDARKKLSAFESKQHQMAFETIFLVQNVTVAPADSDESGGKV
jgi:hypothetical protein